MSKMCGDHSNERCERCDEKLKEKNIVWLELDINSGLYYKEGEFPKDGLSQGYFPFGKTCAKKQLEEQ